MYVRSAAPRPWRMAVFLAALALACADEHDPTAPGAAAASPSPSRVTAAAPAPLVHVAFGGATVRLWPWIGADLSGQASDPVNVLFRGRVDPRQLRAALLLLDGDRSPHFPAQFPFDCTWKDAVGANQAAWVDGPGWTPSALQLECGDFGPIRFHVRFFPAGEWTVANVHFEVLVPGTNQHEILSWELAEQLLALDFMRTGLLDGALPAGATGVINDQPSYRTINPLVFNGLPAGLKALLTGSPSNVSAPVPVATNGVATILNVSGEAAAEPLVAIRDYDLPFDQVIPKPFCSTGPFDWLHVKGAVAFRQRVVVTPSGTYVSRFQANGSLDVTPVNPLTSPPTPVGESYRAQVVEQYGNVVTDRVTQVSNLRLQALIPPSASFGGMLQAQLRLGPGVAEVSEVSVRCGS